MSKINIKLLNELIDEVHESYLDCNKCPLLSVCRRKLLHAKPNQTCGETLAEWVVSKLEPQPPTE
jgi:hypothetical protein